MGDGLGLQSLAPLKTGGKRLVRYSHLDVGRDYVSDSPTPEGFAAILSAADDGCIADMVKLSNEMEAKDLHLQGVANTRRAAVTALDWHIEPGEAADPKDQDLCDQAAAFVQEELENLDTFATTLEHLARAIGPNVAVTELVWAGSRLVETVDVPGHRLNIAPHEGPELRILTEDDMATGIVAEPGKFLVYTPDSRAGFPFAVTLMRAQVWLYVVKHFAIADWAAFSEIFGIPWRIAKCDEAPSGGVRTEVAKMLRDMAADGWALLPSDVEVELIDGAKGEGPHPRLIEWCEKKQSIGFLGQTLTTDTAGVGSFALGKVHDNVRADLLMSDVRKEARAIRQGLIRPMCLLRYPNRKRLVLPHFERELHEAKNIEAARLKLDQFNAARAMGLRMDDDYAYEALDIPKPKPVQAEPEPGGKQPAEIEVPNAG